MRAKEQLINGIPHYVYPDGTALPIIAGGQIDWESYGNGSGSTSGGGGGTSVRFRSIGSIGELKDALNDIGNWTVKTFPEILRDLTAKGYFFADSFYPQIQNSLYALEQAGAGSIADIIVTPGVLEAVTDVIKATGGAGPAGRGGGTAGTGGTGGGGGSSRDYSGEQAAANAFAAGENAKDRAFRAQQAELDRELDRQRLIQQERAERIRALMENAGLLNDIQPDLARFASGVSSLPIRGVTPTVGYGNALEENITNLAGQINTPPPPNTAVPVTPIAPGMAQGGSFAPGGVQYGSNKEGTLVGEEGGFIDGSAEVLVRDKFTNQLLEVIPLSGGAATGATFQMPQVPGMATANYDIPTLYGALSGLYQPHGITSMGAVPNRSNTVSPTALGYVQPKFNTDFAPVQAPAYGPLTTQYFERNTGALLPALSGPDLANLRRMKATNPTLYAITLSMYENATDAQGNYSGLPGSAIDSMIENSAIQGRSRESFAGIGIR